MGYTFRKNKLRRLKRKWRKKSTDRRQNAKIAKLTRLVKSENKYVDQQLQTSIGTTWTQITTRDLTYIPVAAQADEHSRVGNKIRIFRHQIKVVVTTGDLTNLYRILVVRFDQCPTASLGVQNCLENYNNTNPFQIMGFFRRNAPSAYKILYDSGVRTIAGNYQVAESPASSSTQKTHNIILKNSQGWITQYKDDNANSCTNGFTFVVAVSDSSILPSVGFQTMSRTIFSG